MTGPGKEVRVSFIFNKLSAFVKADLDILSRHFKVIPVHWRGKANVSGILSGVLASDVSYSWFIGDHSVAAVFFSRLFGRKSLIVTGGNDLVKMPDAGIMDSPRSRLYRRFVLRNATLVLPFSEDGERAAMRVPGIEDVRRLYLGIDTERFSPDGEKEDVALTVGGASGPELARKGVTTFVKAASLLPEVRFVHVGNTSDGSLERLKAEAPPNVEFMGFLDDDALIRQYRRAKVYVQVSSHEGFGLSMAEAMSCGCAPVVTDRGAIPEVVGDTGIYVPYDNPGATADAIREAMTSDRGEMASKRIRERFLLEKREEALVAMINGLAGG